LTKPKLQIIGRAIMPDEKPNVRLRGNVQRMPKFISLAPFIEEQMTYRTDRALSWVKLPVALLDDERFNKLDDAARAHVVMLMLYVTRTGKNKLTANSEHLSRIINASSRIDVALLLKSKCFVTAKRIRSNICLTPQTDRQTETKSKTTDKTASPPSSSSFSFDDRLRFAHAHASIREPTRFAGATKDGRADDEIAEWLKRTKPPTTAKQDCARCHGSGFEQMENNSVRKCGCKNE
jgi:hypothetical protein